MQTEHGRLAAEAAPSITKLAYAGCPVFGSDGAKREPIFTKPFAG